MKSALFVSALVVTSLRYIPLNVPGVSAADARAFVTGTVFFLYGFVLIVLLLAWLIARPLPRIPKPVTPAASPCDRCNLNGEMQNVLYGKPRPQLQTLDCDPRCSKLAEYQKYIDISNASGVRLLVAARLPNRTAEFLKSINQQPRDQD
jgi:hypothetical protein